MPTRKHTAVVIPTAAYWMQIAVHAVRDFVPNCSHRIASYGGKVGSLRTEEKWNCFVHTIHRGWFVAPRRAWLSRVRLCNIRTAGYRLLFSLVAYPVYAVWKQDHLSSCNNFMFIGLGSSPYLCLHCNRWPLPKSVKVVEKRWRYCGALSVASSVRNLVCVRDAAN